MATGALTEQVAEELEQVAVVARKIDGKAIGTLMIGIGIGATIGFYIGYKYSKKKLRKDVFEEAEKEIAEIREHYQQKIIAAEAQDKPSVEELIAERGYSTKVTDEGIRPLRPPVPVDPPKSAQREIPTPINPNKQVFRTEAAMKDKEENWDWETETIQRRDDEPYIIHQDEFTLNESGYSQKSYVYYSKDMILIDEDDPQTVLNNRENLIGEEALNRFGHGSDDYNIVYVRNSELQLEFEINRVLGSWEEEVLGLDNNEPTR